MKIIICLLSIVLSIYCMLDAYQTKLLFDFGAYEANPFLHYLIEITGSWIIIVLVKLVFISMLGTGVTLLIKRNIETQNV